MSGTTLWLQPELTTLAFCWRLERRDGIVLGFTSHDRRLVLAGLAYHAAPGMVPSAIEQNDGFDADSVEVQGLLTSPFIRAEDLAAGRWDGARLKLYAVDWTAPDTDPLLLIQGEIGLVSQAGESFSAELRGPTGLLDASVMDVTSPQCRAQLGDRACGVDLAPLRMAVTVTDHEDGVLMLEQGLPLGHFAFGSLRWSDGANAGMSGLILAHDATTLTLAEFPRNPVMAGDRAELVQACDRTLASCAQRFGNALNFRGEPHLPGNDLLTRYAG
jgi:uncharacterized phage protein (TIGR02218 family)